MRNPNYASVIVIVSAVGAALYGVSYLVPQFLGIVAGYNAEQSGAIMLLSGLPAFLIMPILPRMLGKFDFRVLVITGLVLYVISCMIDIDLTAQSVGHDFVWSQLIRGTAQMLAMMPLNQASMAAVSQGGFRRRRRSLQHGAQPRRVDRPCDHRYRDRPAHHVSRCDDPRVGQRKFADRPGKPRGECG